MRFIDASSVPNILSMTVEEREDVQFEEFEKSSNEYKDTASRFVRIGNWLSAIEK